MKINVEVKLVIGISQLALCLFALGCGVKGTPLPPEGPPVIGEGYKEWRPLEKEKQQEPETLPNTKAKKVNQ